MGQTWGRFCAGTSPTRRAQPSLQARTYTAGMRSRLLALAAIAVLPLLSACASGADPDEGDAAATTSTTAEPSESTTPSPTENTPEIDDMYVCGQYMPTAAGTDGPITGEIIDLYTAGDITVAQVEDLYDRLVELEAQSSSAILSSVIGVNQPIRYMHEQIAAENYTFNNQWSALEAMTPLLEDCVAIGYTV